MSTKISRTKQIAENFMRAKRAELSNTMAALVVPNAAGPSICCKAPAVDNLVRVVVAVRGKPQDFRDFTHGDVAESTSAVATQQIHRLDDHGVCPSSEFHDR